MALTDELWHAATFAWTAVSLGVSLLSVLSGLYIAFGILCAAQFLGKACNGLPDGLWDRIRQLFSGLLKLAAISSRHASLFGAFPRRRFIAARLFRELEIINPPLAQPTRGHYTEQKFEEKMHTWVREEKDRKHRMKETLRKYLQEEPSFLENCWTTVARRRRQRTPLRPFEIKDFASLDDSRQAIMQYFAALPDPERFPGTWLYGADDEERKNIHKRFLVEASVSVGYLAPIFLITGLLSRASDDDGWKRILDNYRPLMTRDELYATEPAELRELRTFMFNCWLLWGPSIFICTCEEWRTNSNGLLLQYGYGDENHSIDVMVKGGMADEFRQRLANGLSLGTGISGLVGAVPSEVVGRFRWGPDLAAGDIGPAQGFVRGGNTQELRQPIDGRVVLECELHNIRMGSGKPTSQYYSAYLWLAFIMHDGEHLYFNDTWRNCLVFFEHGNIAEPSSYLALKEQLVKKASSTIEALLTRPNVNGKMLHLSYACAFDDANCRASASQPLLPAPQVSAGRAHAQPRDLSIRGLLEDTLRNNWPRDIAPKRLVVFNHGSRADGPPNPFSSCHLPAAVEEFYRALDGLAAERDTQQRASQRH